MITFKFIYKARKRVMITFKFSPDMSVQTKVSPDESHSIWYLDGTSSGQTKFVITNVIAMMPLNFFRSTIFLIYFLYLSACLMVLSSNIPKVQMKSWHHQQTVEWNSRDIVIRTGFHLDFIWNCLKSRCHYKIEVLYCCCTIESNWLLGVFFCF